MTMNAFAMAAAGLETDLHAQAVAAVERALAPYDLAGQSVDHLSALGLDVSIVWLGSDAESYGVRVATTEDGMSLSLVDWNLSDVPRASGRPFTITWAVDSQLLHAAVQEEIRLSAAA